jgi:Uma2 family endonuclease
MSVAVANSLIEVVSHLRPGAMYREDGVTWAEYEELLADLSETSSVRVFYDQGRMEIMSPLPAHEIPVGVLTHLIIILCYELDIEIRSFGSSTLKLKKKNKGAEPDNSFYIQNAAAVIGRMDLDLQFDLPPDLVIESDLTSSSLDRFAIYAALGVPEIWRVFNRRVEIWTLANNAFTEANNSLAFSFLTADVLNQFLAQGLVEGERKASRALRDWVRENS